VSIVATWYDRNFVPKEDFFLCTVFCGRTITTCWDAKSKSYVTFAISLDNKELYKHSSSTIELAKKTHLTAIETLVDLDWVKLEY
jgi:hypothetical protein